MGYRVYWWLLAPAVFSTLLSLCWLLHPSTSIDNIRLLRTLDVLNESKLAAVLPGDELPRDCLVLLRKLRLEREQAQRSTNTVIV
jgi:hypothetical protein